MVINDWYALIRSEHISDFNPHEHNITIDAGYDPTTKEKFDDGVYEMPITIPPGFDLPEHPNPRYVTGRRPRVIADR
jgi:hypothetical protein